MNIITLSIILFLAPLASFAVLIFFGKRMPRGADWLATGAVGVSLLCALVIFFRMLGANDPHWHVSSSLSWLWVGAGYPALSMGFYIDNLTAVMLIVVCIVSFLVHLYSIGYMHGDEYYSRFFAYLSLFTASMLLLVLADNLILLYIGWELVGLSSYLLIGFFFTKPEAASAAKKAFLTTRIGDVGMFIGILLAWWGFDRQLNIQELIVSAEGADAARLGLLTAVSLGLFCGAIGKSAQFPLHVWLPDAMEGPTPVSALIHAATMVAAGVYLVGRTFPLFTPDALLVVALVGGFTAILAGTIALVQPDIKKVLAYSTISQLGYMICGLGCGGYSEGLYHLYTHAFFKAQLFLASGSVIHALHTQDMFEMGGLRKKMPITFWTMIIASLSLAGFPLFSGFFSKDAILLAAWNYTHEAGLLHKLPFLFVILGAPLTAFYMTRLIVMTFFGKPRDEHKHHHAHESPWVMTVPLIVLAALSIGPAAGGWFGHLIALPHGDAAHSGEHGSHFAHYAMMGVSSTLAILAILAGLAVWHWKKVSAEACAERFRPAYLLLLNKYYLDEIYQTCVIGPLVAFARFLGRFDLIVIDGIVNLSAYATVALSWLSGVFDRYVVDGLVQATADGTTEWGKALAWLHTGKIQNYLLKSAAVVVAVLVIGLYFTLT